MCRSFYFLPRFRLIYHLFFCRFPCLLERIWVYFQFFPPCTHVLRLMDSLAARTVYEAERRTSL